MANPVTSIEERIRRILPVDVHTQLSARKKEQTENLRQYFYNQRPLSQQNNIDDESFSDKNLNKRIRINRQ